MKKITQDHTNEGVEDKDVLTFNPNGGGADYIMHKDAQSAWISVGNVSVFISTSRKGFVNVELYPHFHEACCAALDFCTASQTAKRIADKDHESGE